MKQISYSSRVQNSLPAVLEISSCKVLKLRGQIISSLLVVLTLDSSPHSSDSRVEIHELSDSDDIELPNITTLLTPHCR